MGGVAILVGAYVVFVLLFAIGVCWVWPEFVDSSDPPKIRKILLWTLSAETVTEVALVLFGIVKPWMLWVVLLGNIWGMLDAFLRFPIVHDIDSVFGLKQMLLIGMKLIGYALAFRNLEKNLGWFVLAILCYVFTVPILWLTALPIGDFGSYHQKHDSVDEDLAVRFYRLVCSPRERAGARAECRRLGRQLVVAVVRVIPALRTVVVQWDPSLARITSKAPSV